MKKLFLNNSSDLQKPGAKNSYPLSYCSTVQNMKTELLRIQPGCSLLKNMLLQSVQFNLACSVFSYIVSFADVPNVHLKRKTQGTESIFVSLKKDYILQR